MLKQAKNTSPLNQFKNLYFSDAGREELIELLNSKIYQIVNDSIFGYKKKINLKFLFSFCSEEFIISDSHIHTSELNPENSITGNVVFDLNAETANASGLVLQVQTGVWGTQKGKINLD